MSAPQSEGTTASTESAASADPAQDGDGKQTDWQAEARKWEQRAKANKKALDEAAPKATEYEKLRAAQQTDAERASEELNRWQSEAERWRGVAASSRIEALASADFADPSDAVAALGDLSQYLDAGGQIDDKAIRTDLKALLERKPHWRRQGDTPPPRIPAPNRAQGAGNGSAASTPAAEFASVIQSALNRG